MLVNGHTYHALTVRSDGGMINDLTERFRMPLTEAAELSRDGGTFHITTWDTNNVPTVTEYKVMRTYMRCECSLWRRSDTGTLDKDGRITFPSE